MNTGNVRLSNVTIKGAINCSMAAGQLLSPGSSFNCTVSLEAFVLLSAPPPDISMTLLQGFTLLHQCHIQHKPDSVVPHRLISGQ
jgi:hypothetical protein